MTDFHTQQLGKLILLVGIVISIIGGIIILLGKTGLFRLPGDIVFGGKNWKIYFPIISCIIISIILTVILWIISFLKK